MSHSAIYYQLRNDEVIETAEDENPDLNKAEIKQLLKDQWEVLDDEDKLPFEEMSEASKSPMKASKKSPKKSPKSEGERAKRGKSAWIHYFTDPEVREEMDEKGKELMKALSGKWKTMTDEEKEPWVEKALKEKQELEENPIMVEKKVSPRKKTSAREKKLEEEVEKLKKQVKMLLDWKESQEKVEESEDEDEESDSEEDEQINSVFYMLVQFFFGPIN